VFKKQISSGSVEILRGTASKKLVELRYSTGIHFAQVEVNISSSAVEQPGKNLVEEIPVQ
jgi:hypothetical protein